jgi:hypothetical protein
MRHTKVATALLGAGSLILSTLVAFDAASGEGDLKATLEARYAAMKAAMAAHDDAAVSALLAPGFASVDVTGSVETADQMIAEVDTLQPDPNKTSTTMLTSVKQAGDTATVEQRYEMRTVRMGPDGASHKVDLVTLSTDTWVSQKGVWLLSKTVTDELTYSVDGNVTAHRARR